MKTSLSSLLLGLLIGIGFTTPSLVSFSTSSALAQDRIDISLPSSQLIHGHGRTISAQPPPGERFALIAADAPRTPFEAIPNGKRFILTDAVYIVQGSVRQPLTVNVIDADPVTQTQHSLSSAPWTRAIARRRPLALGRLLQV
jgi:hypothetical protein